MCGLCLHADALRKSGLGPVYIAVGRGSSSDMRLENGAEADV